MPVTRISRKTFGFGFCFSSSGRCMYSHKTNSDLPHIKYHGAQNSQKFKELLKSDHFHTKFNNPFSPTQVLRNTTPVSHNSSFNSTFIRDSRHYGQSPKILSTGSQSVLQSKGLQHWHKNWKEARKHKLTASTFAGAIGFFPDRRVQLWREKIGMLEPFSGNLATCWSNIQEEVALERYSLITGNIVSIPTFKIYNENDRSNDWLGASPDALVDSLTYGLPSNGVLEIKCPFFDGEVGKAKPWSQVSFHCMPQAQGLMEILDRDWMDFYCWTPNGSSLFRLHRDKQYWELMKLALSDFWWKHVHPAIEMRSANMTSEMRSLEPAPTHELCGELVRASNCMIRESTLLVREIHGKLQI